MGLPKGIRNKGCGEGPPEQLKWENPTISSVGEEAEQLELSSMAGGAANRGDYLGNLLKFYDLAISLPDAYLIC